MGPYELVKCSECGSNFWSIGGQTGRCISCREKPLPSPKQGVNMPPYIPTERFKGPTVAITGNEMPCKAAEDVLFRLLSDLAEYMSSDVVFITCHGKREYVPSKVDDRLHVFSMMLPVWCPYVIKKFDDMVFTINGNPCRLPPGQKDFADPVDEEIPNCDGIYDDDGVLMALVVGYNIYILNDVMHCENAEALGIATECIKHIIDQAVKIWVKENAKV